MLRIWLVAPAKTLMRETPQDAASGPAWASARGERSSVGQCLTDSQDAHPFRSEASMNPVRRAAKRFGLWLAGGPAPPPRFYAYLGPDVAVTQLENGLFIFVDPCDEGIAPHLIARGYWEAWVDAAVGKIVAPGQRVVDVGANFGYYTLKMARAVGPGGRVESFEAHPTLAGLLERSVAFNGFAAFARVHAQAACDRTGEISFSVSRRHGGSGFVEARFAPDDGTRQTIVVPCVRLDDVVDGPIDVLRMDAEGAEPLVINGARELIARSPDLCVCMEWGVGMMGPRGDVGAMLAWLRGEGFRFWLIATDRTFPELTDDQLMSLPLNDVLVCRRMPVERRR
jgi:FkbM family methyltransferase